MVSLGFWICARGEINRRLSPPGTRRDQGRASPFYAPSLLPAGGRAARIRTRQMQKRRYPNGYLRFWSCWADSNCRIALLRRSIRFIVPRSAREVGSSNFVQYEKNTAGPVGLAVFFWSCWADSNCRPHPYQGSKNSVLRGPLYLQTPND